MEKPVIPPSLFFDASDTVMEADTVFDGSIPGVIPQAPQAGIDTIVLEAPPPNRRVLFARGATLALAAVVSVGLGFTYSKDQHMAELRFDILEDEAVDLVFENSALRTQQEMMQAQIERLHNDLGKTSNNLEATRRLLSALPLGRPIVGANVSSPFGKRYHPLTDRLHEHEGIDYSAPRGTPVLATAEGVVKYSRKNTGYGNYIEIDHGNGLTTRYAHLHKRHVRRGEKVVRGQVIGKVGSTGRSTAPHLHYEVRAEGRALNPSWFVQTGAPIPKTHVSGKLATLDSGSSVRH